MTAKRWSHRTRGMRYTNADGRRAKAGSVVKALDETHLECPKCHGGVRQRQDGTLFGHAIGGGQRRGIDGVPCLGSGEFPVGYEAEAVAV